MPFYDNWTSHDVSKIGMILESWKVKRVLKRITQNINNPKTLLELGPGRGFFYNICLQEGINYFALDVNFSILKLIKASRNVLSQLPKIPLSEGAFDIVFAANVLEHMKDFSEAYYLLEEMKRVTKGGGLVCLIVPDAIALGIHFWNGDYSHSFFTSKRRIAQMFRDLNLELVFINHFSMGFHGLPAKIISSLGWTIPSLLFDFGAEINSKATKRLYSIKTDMLGTIFIIGRKT